MRLLDLFCGAGGAAVGYHRVGFDEIVGVDIQPQSRYPFPFVRADALTYLRRYGRDFDAVHASPPCQRFTNAQRIQQRAHPDWVVPIRAALQDLGLPYVIENVVGAPLHAPLLLCGAMFGLQTYRHRLFESSHRMIAPLHTDHVVPQAKMGRPLNGAFIQVVGNFSDVAAARRAMGISWMTRAELREAIPPAYAEWVGRQLFTQLRGEPPVSWS